MISISINACFQIQLIFCLFIMLLYTCNWIEVNHYTNMNTNQTAQLWDQANLGPYCLQYRLRILLADDRAEDKNPE